MAHRGLFSVLYLLRQLAGASGSAATDGQLLHRFSVEHDENAFAELVQRHGPMVWGICRRTLQHVQDAEDAFQATFLVLARKAGGISRPHCLAGWLHSVAQRTALKARSKAVRQREREMPLEEVAVEGPATEAAWSDLWPVLDREVRALPEKYRLPFVLCYLEGRTNQEAAQLLHCPAGTVMSRLAWARKRLRSRLARRGVTLSSGMLALVLVQKTCPAAVPPLLASAIPRAAKSFAAGQVPVSAAVADLAEGVLKAMYPSKLRLATLAVLGMTLSLTSVGLFHGRSSDSTGPRANAAPDAAKPAAKEKAAPAQPARRDVVQGENYLVFPIATPLQRHLLAAGARETQHPHAYLAVDGGSALGPDGSVNAMALDFNALGKALKRFENAPPQQGPDVIVNVTLPASASEEGAQLLGWALKGFAAERSFPHARLTSTSINGKYSWKDRVERLNKWSADSKEFREAPAEGPLCSVYPVQTMLSRWLTEDADCVVDVVNPLEPGPNGALAANVEKAIRTQLGRLQLPDKDKVLFRLPAGNQQGSQEAARKFVELSALSLAQSLGFKRSSVSIH